MAAGLRTQAGSEAIPAGLAACPVTVIVDVHALLRNASPVTPLGVGSRFHAGAGPCQVFLNLVELETVTAQ